MKSKILLAGFMAALSCVSCKKENITSTNNGIPTVIRGHVEDPIRGINIDGYKIVLIKKVGMDCGGWMCGTVFEKVAEAYTDNNGDYLITFNYKVEPGQDYYLEEQYYGTPYYHESSSGTGPIVGGATNIINIIAWKPVALKLNVQVSNNMIKDLRLRVESNGNKTLNATEFIYEQNATKTYTLRTKPNSSVNIIFWYYTGMVLHQKIIPFQTTLNELTNVNLTIDCSTF
ncbi:MAG TPA: hypothetical protein VK483_05805 [Chitinophagaceae bacterium]|nr:hypothetical protein [Chitinophagaceae bacterium]